MKYIHVRWLHANDEYPVDLYSELDEQRNEVRKIEIFRDGRIGFATGSRAMGGASLGTVPIPALSEMAANPEFVPRAIEAFEFESVWRRFVSRADTLPP
jgi:hypothetical protein